MKKIIFLNFLLPLLAVAQVPNYSLQTVALGTNAIPATGNLALPLLLSTVIQTNPGTQAVFYTATNSATNTVKFTLPATNTLSFTNTFVESNSVVGLASKAWTVYEPVSFTNNTPYYITNAAYVTFYYSTNYTTNSGIVDTWLTNKVYVTNAAVIRTNYQVFSTLTPVPFSITGTDYSTVTNKNYGAGALDMRGSATAILKVSFNLAGAGTGPVTFNYLTTTDGSTDNAVGGSSFSLAANGTSTVSTNVALTLGAAGFLNLTSITNANATNVSNLVIKYAQKISAP